MVFHFVNVDGNHPNRREIRETSTASAQLNSIVDNDRPMLPRMRRFFLLALLVLMAGCGSSTKAAELSTSTTQTTATPAATYKNAAEVFAAIKANNFPIAESVDYTADTDTNHLLGRPHGYTSKVGWHDNRLPLVNAANSVSAQDGGTIEFFANSEDAKSRYDYIDNIQKTAGAISGNDYQYLHGDFVLRVGGTLTPDQAKAYNDALTK